MSPCDGLAYIPSHTHSAWLLVENNLNLFKVVKYSTFLIESYSSSFFARVFFSRVTNYTWLCERQIIEIHAEERDFEDMRREGSAANEGLQTHLYSTNSCSLSC